MRKISFSILVLIYILVPSCEQVTGKKGTLTNEKITNYLNAYKAIRKQAPEILENLNAEGETVNTGQDGFNTFEEIIKKNGLEDFPEFVRLNAKIGAVYSILQAKQGMKVQNNLQNSSQQMLSDGQKLIMDELNNPDVPEETKVELRETLEELKSGSEELASTYKHNKIWADFTIEKVEKITGYLVNDADIQLVKNRMEDITEAYVGFKLPKGFDGNLPKLESLMGL